jgi:hypothetical protein
MTYPISDLFIVGHGTLHGDFFLLSTDEIIKLGKLSELVHLIFLPIIEIPG